MHNNHENEGNCLECELTEKIHILLSKYHEEHEISIAQIIGILELAKLDIYDIVKSNEEDDFDSSLN